MFLLLTGHWHIVIFEFFLLKYNGCSFYAYFNNFTAVRRIFIIVFSFYFLIKFDIYIYNVQCSDAVAARKY